MPELAPEFEELPEHLQEALREALARHGLRVTPLSRLGGGRSGAYLYLASASRANAPRLEHLILKLDRRNPYGPGEVERHRMARTAAPVPFARDHMPDLAMEQVEYGESVVIFYTIAGESLQSYRPLSAFRSRGQFATIAQTVMGGLLGEWNEGASFERATHPRDLLTRWLGYRLEEGGRIETFLQDVCRVRPETPGLLLEGVAYPNPLAYARDPDLWSDTRPIDSILGFQHGDLNTGNILAKFSPQENKLDGYYLIDFALYKQQSPLLYDHAYLELSHLLHLLPQVSLPKWASFAAGFARGDLLDVDEVPIELAGAASISIVVRRAFQGWVDKTHPSLTDDLWGQFLLAATAVGLNFCNKKALADRERLAALIHAAAHLRRYFARFEIPLPAEATALSLTEGRGAGPLAVRPQRDPVHNLPAEVAPVVGREEELKEVVTAFENLESRLVSLVGPGGIGKTRVALRVAYRLLRSFADGVFIVSLAPVASPEGIPQAVAEALGFPLSTEEDPDIQILNHLQRRRLLLVMDNFEHLLDGADFVQRILETAPRVALLVTSRERLNLQAERVRPLSGLAVGEWERSEEALGSSAVQLFLQRAENVEPGFALQEDDLPNLRGILRSVEGNPLGILLAAAWVDVLSLAEIAKEIETSLDFLQSEAPDLPRRQQSLRAAFEASWSLLTPADQDLLRALSVFQGGFTRQAGEEVATASVRDLVALERKSLLHRDPDTGRFWIHEGVRQYAEEKLGSDEAARATADQAHGTYFAGFVENRLDDLQGQRQLAAHREIKDDIVNIRAAWRYWVGRKDPGGLSRFLNGFLHVYDLHGWHHEAVELLAAAAEALQGKPEDPESVVVEARVTAIQGYFTSLLGSPEEGLRLAEEAVDTLRKMDRRQERLIPLFCLALNGAFLNRQAEVEAAAGEALEIARELGDALMEAYSMAWLFFGAFQSGDLEKAARLGNQSLAMFEEQGDRVGQTWPLVGLGALAVTTGDLPKARATYERGLRNVEEIGFQRGRQLFQNNLGSVALQGGEIQEAEKHYLTSLAISEEIGQTREIVGTLYDLAKVKASNQEEDRAVELLSLVLRHPASRQYSTLRRRAIEEEASSLLRKLEDQLPSKAYRAARERAERLELETVVEELLGRTPG
ncbi:MAG: AAA family ATPase [Candidatus Thermoplasmatota archaeon]|nr:AAA family ATPase [Candidatus Thermoplasmatota archaeon]